MQWNKTMKTYEVQFGDDPFTIEVQAHSENAAIREAAGRYHRLTAYQNRNANAVAILKEAA